MNRYNRQKGNAAVIGLVVLLIIVLVAFFVTRDEGTAPAETAEQTFSITIRNLSNTQPLSAGVLAVHNATATLNFEGELLPAELEPLAEYGDNSAAIPFVLNTEGVSDVINVTTPIPPGEGTSYSVTVSRRSDALLSGIMMLVATNDGIAVVDSVPLFDEDGNAVTTTVQGVNLDAGTEENEAPGSGFEGGQPDPSQGILNEDNGVATDPQGQVAAHPQITEPVLEITIEPTEIEGVGMEDDGENMEQEGDTSMKVPAPGVDPNTVDEMIVNTDGETTEEN